MASAEALVMERRRVIAGDSGSRGCDRFEGGCRRCGENVDVVRVELSMCLLASSSTVLTACLDGLDVRQDGCVQEGHVY